MNGESIVFATIAMEGNLSTNVRCFICTLVQTIHVETIMKTEIRVEIQEEVDTTKHLHKIYQKFPIVNILDSVPTWMKRIKDPHLEDKVCLKGRELLLFNFSYY